MKSKKLVWAVYALAIATLIVCVGMFFARFEFYQEIGPESISSWSGKAYAIELSDPPFGLSTISDSNTLPRASSLRLFENGVPSLSAHAVHTDIQQLANGRYSHWWSNKVIFSSFDGTDPRSNGREYSVKGTLVFSGVAYLLILGAPFLLIFAMGWPVRKLIVHDLRFVLKQTMRRRKYMAYSLLKILVGVSLALYVATLIATKTGMGPLGSETDLLSWIATRTHYLPLLILLIGLGTFVLNILAGWNKISFPSYRPSGLEVAAFYVAIATVSILVLGACKHIQDSGATHALRSTNFFGITYSDAGGHHGCAIRVQDTSEWTEFCDRRPVAAALRATTFLLGGRSITGAIWVQIVALGLVLSWVATLLLKLNGFAGSMVFCSLCLVHISPFAPTALTEPLGMLLSLVAIGFLLSAWQKHNLTLVGFCMPFVHLLAQSARMGAIFTVPAIFVWSVASFSKDGAKSIFMAVIVAGTALSIGLVLNPILNTLYGSGGDVGSNFSYVLYGMSVGGDWTTGIELVAHLNEESAKSKVLYGQALNNIIESPDRFAEEILHRIDFALGILPGYFVTGYEAMLHVKSAELPLALCVFFGVCVQAINRRARKVWLFYGPFSLGVVASLPFLAYDDMLRTICVSTPFAALFCAIAMRPAAEARLVRLLLEKVGYRTHLLRWRPNGG